MNDPNPVSLHHLECKNSPQTVEQWKKPGCLGYIVDYTTQLYEDYNKPL